MFMFEWYSQLCQLRNHRSTDFDTDVIEVNSIGRTEKWVVVTFHGPPTQNLLIIVTSNSPLT